MSHRSNFAHGRHITAARAIAGLSQAELAELAGIHRNSLQRWESMNSFQGGWALQRIETALKMKGVIVQRSPIASIAMCAP